jgi:hypothetical protein
MLKSIAITKRTPIMIDIREEIALLGIILS